MVQDASTELVIVDLIRAARIFVAIAANSVDGEEGELSLQQYRALALLSSQEGQRPADLAKSLGVTPSTTTALCDRLVQKGMITRRRRGSDRRSVFLFVSTKGREALKDVDARRGELLYEIFRRLPKAAQKQLADALPFFIEAASQADIEEWSIRGLVTGSRRS